MGSSLNLTTPAAQDEPHVLMDQSIHRISQLSLSERNHRAAHNHELDLTHHPTHYEVTNDRLNRPYSQPADQGLHSTDRLPTYNELEEKEGHRFGRWKGWIEKRARERMDGRATDRREAESQGRSFGTGWDLPSAKQTADTLSQSNALNRNSSIISSRDERAAFHSASRNHRDAFPKHQKGISEGSSKHRLNLESAPGAINLTPSACIQPIGSRFLPQFPSQPLCAIPLPLTHHLTAIEPSLERFLLVGTIDGLYVCDLIPSLSSTVKKASISPTDSKIYQIWQGLGIHQLEIAIEDPLHYSKSSTAVSNPTALPGIVIALTSSTSESTNSSLDGVSKLIKMWPLQSIINLVKFRAFSQNSECLNLAQESSVSKRDSTLTIGTSALAGLKSMFEKSKHKAESSISSLIDIIQQSAVTSHMDPSTQNASGSVAPQNHRFSSGSTMSPNSRQSSPKRESSNPSHLELPLQWAKQTISLNLPRIQAHGPILFIKLSNSPTQGLNPTNDHLDQSIGTSTTPTALRPRSYLGPDDADYSFPNMPRNDGWWYLIIATKQLIFIMESQPAHQRTWHLRTEMSAPFTSKTAHLVLSEFPKANSNRIPSSSRSSPHSRRPNYSRPGIGELSVLLTMKEYAVVISLSDLSVRELDLQGALATSQTTSSLSSVGPTLKPTTGSFSGLDHLDRIQNNFIPFARNLPSIGGSVEPVLTKKRMKDGRTIGLNEGFQVENRRLSSSVLDRRWAGCEELLIPVPIRTQPGPNSQPTTGGRVTNDVTETHHNFRVVYLITRGYFTYAVMCPFGYTARSRSSHRDSSHSSADQSGGTTSGIPPPLLLKPFHTFTWRAIPVKVHARIIPTPSKWEKPAIEQNRRKSTAGYPPPHEHQDEDDPQCKEEVFCCLTAFTASSIEVQEGFISLKFLRNMWETGKKGKSFGSRVVPTSFFTPAGNRYRHRDRQVSSSTSSTTSFVSETKDDESNNLSTSVSSSVDHLKASPPHGKSVDEEDDSNDQSSYDYSAKIGYLCSSANPFPSCALTETETTTKSPNYQSVPNGASNPPLERNSDSFDSTDSNITIKNTQSSSHLNADHQNETNKTYSSTQGSFFWKQAVGEWKIMYVGNNMDS